MNLEDQRIREAVEQALRDELNRRLAAMPPDGFGSGFSLLDYALMVVVGALVPAAALIWGWL